MGRLAAALRALAKVAAVAALLLLAAASALEFAVPQQRLRALCARMLQDRLGREVRLGSVSIGPWRGLRVDGLEISEAPDFSAGTFLYAERLAARPKFWPLLLGRLAFEELELIGPRLRIAREAGGRYNFEGMLAARSEPFAARNAGLDGAMQGLIERAAAAATASLDVELRRAHVGRGSLRYLDAERQLDVSISSVTLWSAGLAPRARRAELELDGRVSGAMGGRPVGADFAFDAEMKLGAGYAPSESTGHLLLDRLRHPGFGAERLRLEWELRDLSSDPRTLSGLLRLDGSGCEFAAADIARQGRWLGLLFYPLETLAKSGGSGLSTSGPLSYDELRGEYSFQRGSVRLAPFSLRGPAASVEAQGRLDLVQGAAGIDAKVTAGKATLAVRLEGPLDSPRVQVSAPAPRNKPKRRPPAPRAKPSDALQEAFQGPETLLPDGSERPPAKAGKKAAPENTRRRATLKDAEKLIEQPLPED